MKILFVTKDMGAGKVAISVAKLAREQSHEVIVFAEGKSIHFWRNDGFEIYFEGVEFPDGTTTFTAEALISEIKPDVVVTGVSSPCHMESKTGLATNKLKIPLVVINDFWSGATRTIAKPDRILAIDGHDMSFYPKIQTFVVGNPSAVPINVSQAVIDAVARLRFKFENVYVYAGGSPEPTTAELQLLIGCLKKTSGNWCLVPRFHPKYAKSEKDGVPYQQIWDEMLAIFADRIVSVPEAKSTDELATLCATTFAAHSLCLIPAIKSGHKAASLWTKESASSLKKQTGLDKVPFVEMGLHQIRESEDLSRLPDTPLGLCQKFEPFDVAKALESVLAVAR